MAIRSMICGGDIATPIEEVLVKAMASTDHEMQYKIEYIITFISHPCFRLNEISGIVH